MNINANKKNVIANKYRKSIIKLAATVIGLIVEEKPIISNILKIFDPRTLPRAISFSPFKAATIEVTSSGREVPMATIVRPPLR